MSTMLQGCRLFKQCRNLPAKGGSLFKPCPNLTAGHCVAGCLDGVGTYLPGTVMQGCRLFKRCLNLPARACVAGMQAV